MKLPILMFHKVAEMPLGARYPGNYVSPALFDAVIGALRGWGYESIDVEDWLAWRKGLRTLPRRPVVITFDDGYRSNRDVAWPILRKHGFHGTIFIVSRLIGRTNSWDADEIQEPLLTEEDLLEMRRSGMRFGSHTRTHAALPSLGSESALSELRGSREDLEHLLGEPVKVVCYPYGKQTSGVRELAREAGYEAGLMGRGRMNGRRRDPLGLLRIKIDNRTSPDRLRARLARLRWLVWW